MIPFFFHVNTGAVPPFSSVAVYTTCVPIQIKLWDEVMAIVGNTLLLIMMLPVLDVPVTPGELALILILYAVPAAVLAGITHEIIPVVAALLSDPITVGLVKLPVALLN